MNVVATARDLAAAHPQAKLPCPLCATTVNAENLAKHLDKVHAGVAPSSVTEWRGKGALGLMPCAVLLDGDCIVLRHTLGILKRAVPLPCAVEIGEWWGKRPEAGMSSYADDMNVPYEDFRVGSYLRLGNAITIGCKGGSREAHWRGSTAGKRRKACDIRLAPEAMVAIEYALVRRGVLAPA